ncbi:NYN domain-containing protein [Paenibacillus senegalensis]|uniref:NYN domain-containing protein n=1 Tax=Paenibacillus senegalensis TaxID=1465766 RepID=UPI0002897B75|nr:NYN domain-containing protein [Paenibacillus senegalensis]
MKEYLIVDGYNIIGAWPELQRLKEIELVEARDRLIEILAEYQAYSGIRVLLVFDAYRVPGLAVKLEQNRLAIYYTKEKETADERIERLVNELSGRFTRIYVATSDMVEQNVIFGKGALRISAAELLVKVRLSRKEIGKELEKRTVSKRNSFDAALSPEIKQLFEKWRRGDHES